MNTSELWLTREEIGLMLNGGLTWAEVSARAQGKSNYQESFKITETSGMRDTLLFLEVEKTDTPEYIETEAGMRLSGFPVLALVGGTGVLTLSLWLYLVIR